MQVVVGGSRRDLVQGVADALAAAGHAVDGICHRLDVTPIAAQALSPQLCLLVVPRAEGSCRDVAAAIQRRSPGSFVLLLTDAAEADVWSVFDAEVLDGVVSLSRPFAALDPIIRAVVAGSRDVVGCLRPPAPVRPPAPSARWPRNDTELRRLLAQIAEADAV